MSIVTKVTAQRRKGHYNIFLDDHYAFSVNEQTLTKFRLLKGVDLTTDQVNEIKDAEKDSKATELAINYLSYQPRSNAEVRQYLTKAEMTENAIENAVANLQDLGYLDDYNFAKLFVKNNLQVGKDGPNAIKQKLGRKKVESNLIEDVLYEIDDEAWLEPGLRLIHSLVHQQGKLATKEIERKAQQKLLSHGFNKELSDLIVAKLDLKNDEEDQLIALKKQGIKVYKRYRNDDNFTRSQKVRRYLYQHGFSGNEIEQFLNGEIVDLSEIDEY